MPKHLIESLQNPALYSHPVSGFTVIETHISWVLLTGTYAYKIKKPVNFGFLNFTELAARAHFCQIELMLNQRLTQGLYKQVLPITGTVEDPAWNGAGPVIEYALKMRQFPQSDLLTELLARGALHAAHTDDLARRVARFHLQSPVVSDTLAWGSAAAVLEPVRQNIEQARGMLEAAEDLTQLIDLERWAEASFLALEPLLNQRKAQGFIRECHGDIHLGNVTLLDGQVTLFDCIEFNEPFRMIDVVSDIAFLIMDLESRGLEALARRVTTLWLEETGDYPALALLSFYKAYRAMVRAKVALFSLAHQTTEQDRQATLAHYRRYAALAFSYQARRAPFLVVMHGVSAVGKSQIALQLVESFGAIRLRSDVERKRLFGAQKEQFQSSWQSGIYSPEASTATYAHLHRVAAELLSLGYSVVIDAAYLKEQQRLQAAQVAAATGVPYLIVACTAPQEQILERLAERVARGDDPSDATAAVVEAQLQSKQPFTPQEQYCQISVDTAQPSSAAELATQVREYLAKTAVGRELGAGLLLGNAVNVAAS